jgi:hypothetical protein
LVRDCRRKPVHRRCRKLRKAGFPAFVVGHHVIAKELRMDAIRSLTACP